MLPDSLACSQLFQKQHARLLFHCSSTKLIRAWRVPGSARPASCRPSRSTGTSWPSLHRCDGCLTPSIGYNCDAPLWPCFERVVTTLFAMPCFPGRLRGLLLTTLLAQDHTANQWLTAFQETGVEIMGMTANDLQRLQTEHPTEFEKVMLVRSICDAATTQHMLMTLSIKPSMVRASWLGDASRTNDMHADKCSVHICDLFKVRLTMRILLRSGRISSSAPSG